MPYAPRDVSEKKVDDYMFFVEKVLEFNFKKINF